MQKLILVLFSLMVLMILNFQVFAADIDGDGFQDNDDDFVDLDDDGRYDLPISEEYGTSQPPKINSSVAKDILIIHKTKPLAYFGWYRTSQMTAPGWELFLRVTEWVTGSAKPANINVILFTYDGSLGEEDCYSVYSNLIGNGYNVAEIRRQSDAETLPPSYYGDFDLAVYAWFYAYDVSNIVDSNIPFISIASEHTDEMGIGTGIETMHEFRDRFYVVDNSHYITQPYLSGILLFDETMWTDASEATDSGIALVGAVRPGPPLTFYVDCANTIGPWDGTSENPFQYIQDGIDASENGDTVQVSDGIYKGDGNVDLRFGGKEINVKSENGPPACVIDCEGNSKAFYIYQHETEESVINGFKIINGSSYECGAICCHNSSPTIENNVIMGNSSKESGGAITCLYYASPKIISNRIIGNSASTYGGGIYCTYNSSPEISRNIISENLADKSGGGIYCSNQAFPTVTNNVISGNSGGGIVCDKASPIIINNTIVKNLADQGGGIDCRNSSSPVVMNTILWRNDPEEIYVENSTINITFSNIQGGFQGIGNIDFGPSFLDMENGDYHLTDYSFCIGGGKLDGAPDDDIESNPRPNPPGSNPDIGAYESPIASSLDSDKTPPSTISDLSAAVGMSGRSINLTWSAPEDTQSNINLYIIKYNDVEITEENWDSSPAIEKQMILTGSLEPNSAGVSESMTVAMPTSRHLYHFAIKTWDAVWNLSGISNEASAISNSSLAWYVSSNGSNENNGRRESPFATIQHAIDIAIDGETVIVNDGEYTGYGNKNLDFIGKDIAVVSENGASKCVINCEFNGRAFYFHSGETNDAFVGGFTIKNGSDYETGGGIYCNNSSPTIENNIITGNSANRGGGIYCANSSALIQSNAIMGNRAYGEVGECWFEPWLCSAVAYGGGIYCADSSPIIVNNVIARNNAMVIYQNYPPITYPNFSCIAEGGGIYCINSSLTMQNNTIEGNKALSSSYWWIYSQDPDPTTSTAKHSDVLQIYDTIYGGGIFCASSVLSLNNTILWNNYPWQIYITGNSGPNVISISYSDIQQGRAGINTEVNWLEGNIDVNPLFVDVVGGDYRLRNISPCIGGGIMNQNVPNTDIEGNPRPNPNGSNPDIGAYESPLWKPLPSIEYKMKAGWNLISLAVSPDNNALQNLLAPIWDNVKSVWTYESKRGWRRYVVGGPDFSNDLFTMEVGRGYWVNMDSAATLIITGNTIDAAAITLYTGWNMVGYNSDQLMDTNTAIAFITQYCNSIYTYDGNQWLRWMTGGPTFLNNLAQLEPGRAYWFNVTTDCVWNISP